MKLTKCIHNCETIVLEPFKYLVYKIAISWRENYKSNAQKEIFFDVDRTDDKLLLNLKAEIAKLINLEENWTINDLCQQFDNDFSIISFVIGSLLQREISIFQTSSKIIYPSWKSNTTQCVTLYQILNKDKVFSHG